MICPVASVQCYWRVFSYVFRHHLVHAAGSLHDRGRRTRSPVGWATDRHVLWPSVAPHESPDWPVGAGSSGPPGLLQRPPWNSVLLSGGRVSNQGNSFNPSFLGCSGDRRLSLKEFSMKYDRYLQVDLSSICLFLSNMVVWHLCYQSIYLTYIVNGWWSPLEYFSISFSHPRFFLLIYVFLIANWSII